MPEPRQSMHWPAWRRTTLQCCRSALHTVHGRLCQPMTTLAASLLQLADRGGVAVVLCMRCSYIQCTAATILLGNQACIEGMHPCFEGIHSVRRGRPRGPTQAALHVVQRQASSLIAAGHLSGLALGGLRHVGRGFAAQQLIEEWNARRALSAKVRI
jgi:hypothetical protein